MLNKPRIPLIGEVVTVLFHIPLSYYFVWELELGIEGTGIAFSFSNLITYCFLLFYSSFCIPEIKEAIIWPNRSSFEGIREYMKIGIPTLMMLILDWWA